MGNNLQRNYNDYNIQVENNNDPPELRKLVEEVCVNRKLNVPWRISSEVLMYHAFNDAYFQSGCVIRVNELHSKLRKEISDLLRSKLLVYMAEENRKS
jgi:hypothetical protein